MPTTTTNTTFNINVPSVSLEQGEELIFKFQCEQSISSSGTFTNFTASLGQGSLRVSSLAVSVGYTSVSSSQFFDSSSISLGTNTNEIIFSTGLSGFHDNDYIFVPNPLSGSENSLYPVYGDVDYNFVIRPYDIIIIYLSDDTYVENRVISLYKQSNKLHLVLDNELSGLLKYDLSNGTYVSFLILSRRDDETNAYLTFRKRAGKTSYGFVIPYDISPDILNNIDIITKEVKQKLLADQQGTTL